MMSSRVLLCDDHVVLLEGLQRLLEPEFDVVAAVSDGHALVAEATNWLPDVIVFDITMPLLNGIEAARQVRSIVPSAKLVVLSQHSDSEFVHAAFRLGASAYVLKNAASAELLTAIREALAGRYYVSSELRARFPEVPLGPHENPAGVFANQLTQRQREVLQLVAEGKTAKEIAHLLNISVKTVEFHKAGIMSGLGIRTTAELTRYAIQHRIVTQ